MSNKQMVVRPDSVETIMTDWTTAKVLCGPQITGSQALGAVSLAVAADLRQYIGAGSTLAITPEPRTGGPGGQPSGPILASGKVTTI